MECGKKYQVHFSVRSGDVIEKVEEVKFSNFCSVRGFKFVYRMPEPKMFSTCVQVEGKHSHWVLKGSSMLLADDSKGEFAYFNKGNNAICPGLMKKLDVGIGDFIALRSVEMPVAEEIVLQPTAEDTRPVIPKMVYLGLVFLNPANEAHEIYGGVFTPANAFRIVSVKGNSKTGFFKFSRFYSKVTLLKPSHSILPKNLYKTILPKGHFSSLPCLSSTISDLVKLGKVHSIIHLISARGCGKRAAVFKAGWKLGYKVQEISMCSISTLKSLESLLSDQPEHSFLHLRQFNEGLSPILSGQEDLLLKIRDIFARYQSLDRQCTLILSSSLSTDLPSAIRNQTLKITLPSPEASSRKFLLFHSLGYETTDLIQSSSGKSIEDLLSLKELEDQTSSSILSNLKNSNSGIPNVKWEDVGGLQTAKKEIIDTIQLPLLHPEFFKIRPRSGLLLYGPPGTGKTLLAKAIATECSLNFLSVKGPELLNMYIGESEKNVRELFERARALQPCVLFFDELDSLAPKRGQGSDLGVMDRIVSQLLTEIDSLQTASKLFIIGATNRPDLLDSALLRPGRFDKMVFLGIPDDFESKVKVFLAQTRKFVLDFHGFEEVAKRCPGRYSGADIYAVCAQALSIAYLEKVKILEGKYREFVDNEIYEEVKSFEEWVEGQDLNVVVCQEHFFQACDVVKPTISEEDLEKYKFFGK
jgi:SpoVK/Ycf46/Vps4 family AAA+-type ATPase